MDQGIFHFKVTGACFFSKSKSGLVLNCSRTQQSGSLLLSQVKSIRIFCALPGRSTRLHCAPVDQIGQWNWERWHSEEYTRLNEQAMTSVDAAERDGFYQQMMKLMWDSRAYVPINHVQIGWLTRDDINMNFIPNARLRPRRIAGA